MCGRVTWVVRRGISEQATLKLRPLCQEGATTHHCGCISGRCSKLVQWPRGRDELWVFENESGRKCGWNSLSWGRGVCTQVRWRSITRDHSLLLLRNWFCPKSFLAALKETGVRTSEESGGGCSVQMRARAVWHMQVKKGLDVTGDPRWGGQDWLMDWMWWLEIRGRAGRTGWWIGCGGRDWGWHLGSCFELGGPWCPLTRKGWLEGERERKSRVLC